MRDISRIYKTYLEADSYFSRKESNTRSHNGRQKWTNHRTINDQAYYVLLFAQFEDYIIRKFKRLVVRKKSATQWSNRRLWDNVEINKYPFLKKVALLTEKGKTDYNKISDLYEIRNKIAHGDTYTPIFIPTYVHDLKSLAKRLRE